MYTTPVTILDPRAWLVPINFLIEILVCSLVWLVRTCEGLASQADQHPQQAVCVHLCFQMQILPVEYRTSSMWSSRDSWSAGHQQGRDDVQHSLHLLQTGCILADNVLHKLVPNSSSTSLHSQTISTRSQNHHTEITQLYHTNHQDLHPSHVPGNQVLRDTRVCE